MKLIQEAIHCHPRSHPRSWCWTTTHCEDKSKIHSCTVRLLSQNCAAHNSVALSVNRQTLFRNHSVTNCYQTGNVSQVCVPRWWWYTPDSFMSLKGWMAESGNCHRLLEPERKPWPSWKRLKQGQSWLGRDCLEERTKRNCSPLGSPDWPTCPLPRSDWGCQDAASEIGVANWVGRHVMLEQSIS